MDEFDFACPDCGVELSVEASDVGDALDCPSCGNVLQIEWGGSPAGTSAAAPAPASDGTATVSGAPRRPGGKKMKMRGKKKMTMSRRPAATSAAAEVAEEEAPAESPAPKKRTAGGKSVVMKTRTRSTAGTPRRGGAPPAVESDYGGAGDPNRPRPKSVAGIVVGVLYCMGGSLGCLGGILNAVMGSALAASTSGAGTGADEQAAAAAVQAGAAIIWVIAVCGALFGGFILFVGISLIMMKNWARITAVVIAIIQTIMILTFAGFIAVMGIWVSTQADGASNKSEGIGFTIGLAIGYSLFAIIPLLIRKFLTTTRAKVAYGALPVEALDAE